MGSRMAGQTTVIIDGLSWECSVASSVSELTSGLSGVESILAGTGMLFDMGADQNSIVINMDDMLFSLDIVFINSGGQVVGVLHGVEPGESAAFDAGNGLGARYFIEVNAGEAIDVSVGDIAVVETAQAGGINLSGMLEMVVVVGMMGLMMKSMVGRKT